LVPSTAKADQENIVNTTEPKIRTTKINRRVKDIAGEGHTIAD
jgi:hypothetical protein